MKSLMTWLACSVLLLVGCGKEAVTPETGFKITAPREDIVAQLGQLNAEILKDSPNEIQAEFTLPDQEAPMRFQLLFKDGQLWEANNLARQ